MRLSSHSAAYLWCLPGLLRMSIIETYIASNKTASNLTTDQTRMSVSFLNVCNNQFKSTRRCSARLVQHIHLKLSYIIIKISPYYKQNRTGDRNQIIRSYLQNRSCSKKSQWKLTWFSRVRLLRWLYWVRLHDICTLLQLYIYARSRRLKTPPEVMKRNFLMDVVSCNFLPVT